MVAQARVRSGVGSYIGAPDHVAIGRNSRLLSIQNRLYLDHAATTPVLAETRAAMTRALDAWANPNSPHSDGRAARALLEEARSSIAETMGWRHDVIFTSGASEAVEIAAARARVPGRARGATEHAIVPHAMGSASRVIAVGPGALGFAAALAARPYDMERLAALRSRLEGDVQESGGIVIAGDAPRIATIGAMALPGASSASLLVQLDLAGIAISAGSACSSGK